MLSLKNISHKYENSPWIFSELDFQFENKKYVIIGPSGIGKSTLLHIINGLIQPIGGRIDSQYKTTMIFQSLNLLTDFTVRENIELALRINNLKLEYDELVSILGIENILDKFPNEISGGQKQRAAIARALSIGANFILADEPTGNLDAENACMIRELFKLIYDKLNIGFIISTHDHKWLEIADVQLQIVQGKLCKC